ncbi:MAG TPA: SHOCT domain-containing protein [Chloroflexia bacterium]|nr:SHOCT domain-containing protein [Chloroflexia bacterium]
MMSFYGMGGLGMVAGLLFCLFLLGLIAWGLFTLLNSQRENERLTALEILDRRYARSEISRAEYEQAVQNLYRL